MPPTFRLSQLVAPSQIQGNVDREMGIAASLVAQGKKDRALLALKRKKLQARPWARRGWHPGAVHALTLLSSPCLPAGLSLSFATLPHPDPTPLHPSDRPLHPPALFKCCRRASWPSFMHTC